MFSKEKDHSSSCRCKHCLPSPLAPRRCARPRGPPRALGPVGACAPRNARACGARPAPGPPQRSRRVRRGRGPLLPPGGQRLRRAPAFGEGGVLAQPWESALAARLALRSAPSGLPGTACGRVHRAGAGHGAAATGSSPNPAGRAALESLRYAHTDDESSSFPSARLFNERRMGTIGYFSPSRPLFSCMQISTRGFYAHFSFRRELQGYKFISVLHTSPLHNWP